MAGRTVSDLTQGATLAPTKGRHQPGTNLDTRGWSQNTKVFQDLNGWLQPALTSYIRTSGRATPIFAQVTCIRAQRLTF